MRSRVSLGGGIARGALEDKCVDYIGKSNLFAAVDDGIKDADPEVKGRVGGR